MKVKRTGLNVSFYLLTPEAKSQSLVYASISEKGNSQTKRLRFSTGESFITKYCTSRGKKGKDLLKKNSSFYLEYSSKLDSIRNTILHIEQDSRRNNEKPSLEEIRDAFYVKSGVSEPAQQKTFEEAWNEFCASSQSAWQNSTKQHFKAVYSHLMAFEKQEGKIIQLSNLNIEFWDALRDKYFVGVKRFSNNSINKNLKKLRQFFHFLNKKEIIEIKNVLDMKFLEEIEPFKIALKLNEIDSIMKLDLSEDSRLDRIRDLFALETMTGQRFSDIPALLNKNNISETAISIYQKKGNEKVNIPLHPKLKTHLKKIFKKYPNGLPVISNQKFNDYLKEICIKANFNQEHSWVALSGNTKIQKSDFRYNLCSSHVGRRTFCTLALAEGINPEIIMKVTGHKNYDQFRDYVKVDDSDVNAAFDKFMK